MGLTSASQAQIKDMFNKAKSTLTNDGGETGMGLKEALNAGVDAAVTQLSAKDGYLESPYKILIPEDAQKVIDKVKKVPGFGDVEQKLINPMN
jgi:guanyl-specific ribonuclease Sa